MESEENPTAMFLRLQNGDDIVAETVEIEDEDGILYMVINPLKIVYMQSQHTGYLSVSFIPWVFTKICDHQEFTIHAQDVLLVTAVSEKMNDYYWNNLTSNKVDECSPENEPTETQQDQDEETLAEILKGLNSKRTYH